MIFDINGALVEFDENKDNYNKVRKDFKFLAKSLEDKFCENLFDTTLNINILSKNSIDLYNKYIDICVRKGVETLIDFKLISIDKNTFKEQYCLKYLNFERFLNNKVKQAIPKGKKNKYLTYKSLNSLVVEFSKYLYDDCFNVHKAVIDSLLSNGVKNISSPISCDDINLSNALFNNYKDGFIHKIDEVKVVSQIISTNPYRIDVYEYLIKEDGDFNKEIEKLVNYLGYDVKEYKENLMDIYIKNIIEQDNCDVEFDKEKVEKYAKYIGCDNESIYTTRIEAIYTFQNV